jgi:CRISPR system Cascade subunit CasE
MSFITLAELRRDTPQARKYAREAMNDAHKDAGHRLIWRLFSDDPKAKRDFVFRMSDEGRFMIVSPRKPEGDETVWRLKTKPYVPKPVTGQRFGFSLRVNPTFASSQPDRKNSKKVDVLMHAKKDKGAALEPEERERVALAWLKTKLAKAGAEIDVKNCQILDYSQIHLERRKTDPKATISVIDVEGVLEVTEPAALQKALIDGIGHAKAFGLGLLLLRPLES